MRSRLEDLQAQLDKALEECERLREENERLRILLGFSPREESPNIQVADSQLLNPTPENLVVTKYSSPKEKIALFRSCSLEEKMCTLSGGRERTENQVTLLRAGTKRSAPRLDTLFLAMPISWKGTLQQYAGRLHRLHSNKRVVKIYDYVDSQIPMLMRIYEKRLQGYRDMGYQTQVNG